MAESFTIQKEPESYHIPETTNQVVLPWFRNDQMLSINTIQKQRSVSTIRDMLSLSLSHAYTPAAFLSDTLLPLELSVLGVA